MTHLFRAGRYCLLPRALWLAPGRPLPYDITGIRCHAFVGTTSVSGRTPCAPTGRQARPVLQTPAETIRRLRPRERTTRPLREARSLGKPERLLAPRPARRKPGSKPKKPKT